MNAMKLLRCALVLLITLSAAPSFPASRQPRNTYDIIIAGAGTGGISAAIQASRMGASVLVVEPSTWIGGQATAAGVSTMDDMSRQMSGIYLDFITRIKNYYTSRGKSMGTCYWNSNSVAFEPRIGQEAFVNLINEARRHGTLDFLMNSEITAVKKEGRTVKGVTIQAGDKTTRNYSCRVLIDATEYGDILPLSKTQYRAGNSLSGFLNSDAMIQDITWVVILRKYPGGVPSYLRPSQPLPGYDLARRNYQSYITLDGNNFRNTYPVATPVNFITHNAYRGLPDSSNPWSYDADRDNRPYITKTSVNWANDYPGTYGWTNGRRGLPIGYLEDRALRLQIEREALIKSLHFIYYVQHELGESWSVADDEYTNRILPEAARTLPREWQEIARRMPPVPYVRESRRIVAGRTLTSYELLQNSLSYRDGTSHEFSDAIAIGGYILDLHGANTDADMEWEFEERAHSSITNRPRGPFQVPMSILVPSDTDGLIAAEKNLSMSRLTAGALRLQPITIMTGQAAGALAAVSVRDNRQPANVHPIRVQWELLNYGVSLSLCHYSDVPPEHGVNKSVQLSNLYALIEPNEFPHSSQADERAFEDPVRAMTEIRSQNKGVFGVNDMITLEQANTYLRRAQAAIGIRDNGGVITGKMHNFISRGDFARAVYEAFPALSEAKPQRNSRSPFKLVKHRNAEYVEKLGRLGVLDVYRIEADFHYGYPVTKGEAADIIVRACVAASGV